MSDWSSIDLSENYSLFYLPLCNFVVTELTFYVLWAFAGWWDPFTDWQAYVWAVSQQRMTRLDYLIQDKGMAAQLIHTYLQRAVGERRGGYWITKFEPEGGFLIFSTTAAIPKLGITVTPTVNFVLRPGWDPGINRGWEKWVRGYEKPGFVIRLSRPLFHTYLIILYKII